MEHKKRCFSIEYLKDVYLQKKKEEESEKYPRHLKDVFESLGYHYVPVPTASYDSGKTYIFSGDNGVLGYVGLIFHGLPKWCLELGIITEKDRTPDQQEAIDELVRRLEIFEKKNI
jgi:hypothetical protein